MKKLLTIFSVFILTLCLMVFVGCGNTLEVPEKIRIDDDYNMTWGSVEYARTYSLEIKNVETGEIDNVISRKTSYSLANCAEGDYEIRIKAVPREGYGKESEWSEVVAFHKNYETGCIYTLINNNTEYAITGAGTSSDSFTIEEVYRGKPVTAIEHSAFRSSNVKNIVIGNNVRTISDEAFYNCSNLESVVIPNSVTSIGRGAFHSCLVLKNITLPDSLTEISELTFAYCRSLESVVFGENTVNIGESAFAGCRVLKNIELPQSLQTIASYAFSENEAIESVTFGANLLDIGPHAFSRCTALNEVNFAENSMLVRVSDRAFQNCVSLQKIDLPEGLQILGIGVFYGCSELSQVTLPQSLVKVGSSVFNGTKIYASSVESGENLIYAGNWVVGVYNSAEIVNLDETSFKENTVGISGKAFLRCENLETVKFPASIKYLGDSSFANNEKLHRVTIPNNGVEDIGASAFLGCESLNNLSIGEGLKRIGTNAFYGCTRLRNNENPDWIPQSVTTIGRQAFMESGLWKEPDEYGIVYAGNWVVGYNPVSADGKKIEISDVILKDDTRGIADYAFSDCVSLKNITGGISNVRNLGVGAFYGCTGLTAITLNDNLQEIPDYTFYKCSDLFRIDIPLNLKKIGRSAFYDCRTLSSLDLSGARIEEIGPFAFFRCKNISEINFGDSVKNIGSFAFMSCISLTTVELPGSVVSIGALAFQDCTSLTEVKFVEGETINLQIIGQYAFARCTKLAKVAFPDSLLVIGDYAFSDCSRLANINLNEGLLEIGAFAFYNNRNVKFINFPSSLQKIGGHAFRACGNLSSVLLKNNIEEIGAHTFYGCYQLTIYIDGTSVPQGWSALWNSSFMPIVLGCTTSTEGNYLQSITIAPDMFLNTTTITQVEGDEDVNLSNVNLSAPSRDGYICVGWTTQSGSTNVEITMAEVYDLPEGTVIYPVWEVYVEPEIPSEENPNPDGEETPPEQNPNPDGTETSSDETTSA